MAKFIYKMQNILNIKVRLETQAKTEFAEASARYLEEENKLKELLSRRRFYELEITSMATGNVDVKKLKIQNDALKAMKDLIEQQALTMRIAQRNMDRAREKLDDAVKERKVYEKLKEKEFEDFKMELNAEEKKEIDELVSFTYNDKKES